MTLQQLYNNNTKWCLFYLRYCITYSFRRFAKPYVPNVPGMDTFEGHVLHSCQYNYPTEIHGKRVLILGAYTSGQDIAMDIAPLVDKVISFINNKVQKGNSVYL